MRPAPGVGQYRTPSFHSSCCTTVKDQIRSDYKRRQHIKEQYHTSSMLLAEFRQLVILVQKEEVVGELQSSKVSTINSSTDMNSGILEENQENANYKRKFHSKPIKNYDIVGEKVARKMLSCLKSSHSGRVKCSSVMFGYSGERA